MEEASSPTDISSSLSEFVRKERILKELYQGKDSMSKPFNDSELSYNDDEIDNILQQMGRLLSPNNQDSDNKIYKHVIAETENKSIEQILSEAKELISNNSPHVNDSSIGLSADDLSSVCSENDVTFINIEDFKNYSDCTDEKCSTGSCIAKSVSARARDIKNSKNIDPPLLERPANTACQIESKKDPVECKMFSQNKSLGEIQSLKEEVHLVNDLYQSCRIECVNLRSEMNELDQQWKQRENQLLQENFSLKRTSTSNSSQKEFKNLQTKLNKSNDTIAQLKLNMKKNNDDWRKKEIQLINECDQLRQQLKRSSTFSHSNIEKLQEQLKDCEEMNVKLKLDFDNCKDKCITLEALCTDLKKVIIEEQITEKLCANDNISPPVRQYLSSSSSSVITTLSHMFGCLSCSRTRNRLNYGQKNGDMITTIESSVIHGIGKSFEHNDLVKELLKEKEQLRKVNLDLNRQVKEMEKIVQRRAHANFSSVSEIIKSNESKMYEKESETIKNLKKELLEKHQIIIDLKNEMVETKAHYDQKLLSLQRKIVNIQEESMKMKDELEKKKVVPLNHAVKCKHKGGSCGPQIRNFRIELSAKEREIQSLSKQLEELKKKNRKSIHKDKENYYHSSKEQSTEEIQLSRKASAIFCGNEKTTQHGSNYVAASQVNRKKEEKDIEMKQTVSNEKYEYDGENIKMIPCSCQYKIFEEKLFNEDNFPQKNDQNDSNNYK